jgi:hypothetical protein
VWSDPSCLRSKPCCKTISNGLGYIRWSWVCRRCNRVSLWVVAAVDRQVRSCLKVSSLRLQPRHLLDCIRWFNADWSVLSCIDKLDYASLRGFSEKREALFTWSSWLSWISSSLHQNSRLSVCYVKGLWSNLFSAEFIFKIFAVPSI